MPTVKLEKNSSSVNVAKTSFSVKLYIFNSELKGNIIDVVVPPSTYEPMLDFSIPENSQYIPII